MEIVSILNLVAIIVIPVFAVIIGQYLQNRAKKLPLISCQIKMGWA